MLGWPSSHLLLVLILCLIYNQVLVGSRPRSDSHQQWTISEAKSPSVRLSRGLGSALTSMKSTAGNMVGALIGAPSVSFSPIPGLTVGGTWDPAEDQKLLKAQYTGVPNLNISAAVDPFHGYREIGVGYGGLSLNSKKSKDDSSIALGYHTNITNQTNIGAQLVYDFTNRSLDLNIDSDIHLLPALSSKQE